jgi:hypothetical protein
MRSAAVLSFTIAVVAAVPAVLAQTTGYVGSTLWSGACDVAAAGDHLTAGDLAETKKMLLLK